jgi:VIT1/CCC1 family predicted Fe2+/Mn2+ transporter
MSERFIGIGLGVVFLVLIANMGMVAYFGLHSIESEHAQARSMATHEWIDVQLAEEALAYSSRNTRINMQLVASRSRAEINSLKAQSQANNDEINAIIKRLRNQLRLKTNSACWIPWRKQGLRI